MVKRNNLVKWMLIVVVTFFLAVTIYGKVTKPRIDSEAAILVDARTGEIIFEKNKSKAYPVASMSKLMTEYIVLDHITDGHIYWDNRVVMSETANDIISNGVRIPVETGDVLTVHDLFAAMVISSANNATIALAEYIAGTEEAFTVLMNEKAAELGLSEQTSFVNATGLPASKGENRMSAEDLAVLASSLVQEHAEVLVFSSYLTYQLDTNGRDIYSTNKMLNENNRNLYVAGLDGLKTGYTDAAGYGFAGTARQGEQRLISVIIDAQDEDQRFIETKKLLHYGFGKMSFPPVKEAIKSILK